MNKRPGSDPPSSVAAHRRDFRFQTFASLKYRNFRFLWGGTLFSSAGNWIQQVTLGWLMYDMTENAFLVGTLLGARALPFLLVGPIAGVIADRMDRRRVLLANQFFLGFIAIGFAVVVASGLVQVWHLFVFTLLSGAGWAFNNPVRQALVANSVPARDLVNAIALNSMGFNITRVLGPAFGGLLIAFFGPATNFFIQAVCYMGVALMVFPINIPKHDVSSSKGAPILSNLAEGLRYVSKEPTILGLILVALIPALFIMPFVSGLMPVFSEEVLHAGPEGLGLLLSALGVGGLTGALVLATIRNVGRRGILLLGAAMSAGLLMILFSRTTWMPLSLACLVGVGTAHMAYMTTTNIVIQTITPDKFRGRVMSLYHLDFGLVPLGGLIAGTIAQFYGSPAAVLIGGGITTLLILLVAVKFRAIRYAGATVPGTAKAIP